MGSLRGSFMGYNILQGREARSLKPSNPKPKKLETRNSKSFRRLGFRVKGLEFGVYAFRNLLELHETRLQNLYRTPTKPRLWAVSPKL